MHQRERETGRRTIDQITRECSAAMARKSRANFVSRDRDYRSLFKRVGETDSQSSLTLRKVDVGGHSLNLLIGGQGSPAVVFEGGFGAGGRKSSQFN
jgi:hypothetical protein